MTSEPSRRVLPYGDRAVLVECADLSEMRALRDWLAGQDQTGIEEVIPGARTLLLRLAGPLDSAFLHEISSAPLPEPAAIAADLVRIGVHYDGEDLAEVASLLGCRPEQVIERHTGQRWTVAFCGFAPGFAYLAPEELPGRTPGLTVPRRSSPRTKVPPGSVGLADRWSGIYPRAAPGGWQLIGRTDLAVWDLGQDPPALLQPGMQVQFERAR